MAIYFFNEASLVYILNLACFVTVYIQNHQFSNYVDRDNFYFCFILHYFISMVCDQDSGGIIEPWQKTTSYKISHFQIFILLNVEKTNIFGLHNDDHVVVNHCSLWWSPVVNICAAIWVMLNVFINCGVVLLVII